MRKMSQNFAGLALALLPMIGFAQGTGSQNQKSPSSQQQNQNRQDQQGQPDRSQVPSSPSAAQNPNQTGNQNPTNQDQRQQEPPPQQLPQRQAQQPEAPAQPAPTPVQQPSRQSRPQVRETARKPSQRPAQEPSQQPTEIQTRTVIRKTKTTRRTQKTAKKSQPIRQSGSSSPAAGLQQAETFSAPSRVAPGSVGVTALNPALAGRINPLLQDRISLERTELQSQVRTVAEALSAVEETRSAVGFLNSQNLDRANAALTNALSKIETLLAQHSDLSLVPIVTEVRVMDFVSDPKMVNSVTQDARALVTVGRFQAARRLLRNFASEINIETTSIPMATYPNAIREAGRLLKQGKVEEAKADLIGALNTLVITEKSVPLPLIKAQALVDEVNRGVLDKSMKKTEANQLLNEASSQLQMAQLMGYGSGPQDFIALQNTIHEIQMNLNQNQDSRNLLARIRNDFESLKKRTL